jgi:RsmE family RNA methyltransferase
MDTQCGLAKLSFPAETAWSFRYWNRFRFAFHLSNKTLLLAVVKFDAFEWAIEKATELGVNRIVPLAAARSEKGLLVAAAKRTERWKKIAFEASQQSRRGAAAVIENVMQATAAFSSRKRRTESNALRTKRSAPDAGSFRRTGGQ